MQRFTELRVWRRSHALVLDVYRMTAGFPAEERFGLTAQLRRAAVSVAANAEGSKRRQSSGLRPVHQRRRGSVAEMEYLNMIGRDLKYSEPARANAMLTSTGGVAGMLHMLRSKVQASDLPSMEAAAEQYSTLRRSSARRAIEPPTFNRRRP